jgi:hypothetical protein
MSYAVTPDVRKKASWKRWLGIAMVLLGWLGCNLDGYHHRSGRQYGIDFRSVYSSSRCLIEGCNPYNETETMAVFLKNGGTMLEAGPPPIYSPFKRYYAGYPPVTLFYLMPLAALHWPLAWHVWIVFEGLLFGLAAGLFADLCAEDSPLVANFFLAVFLLISEMIIKLSQPAMVAAALCCIGVWCLLKKRYVVPGIICFAFSLAFKPHVGGLILLYFFLATPEYRKRTWQIIGTTVIFCLPALLFMSLRPVTRNWVHDYSTNLKGIAARGDLSYPGRSNAWADEIADLQTVVGVIRDDPAFFNPVVYAFSLVVMAVWVYPVIRLRPSREKDLLCIAAIASFSLLPVYHRNYDSRVLVLIFPAIALLLRRNVRWGAVAAFLSLVLSFTTSEYYSKQLYGPHGAPLRRSLAGIWDGRLLIILFERQVAMTCLTLTIFFIALMYLFLQKRLFPGEEPEETMSSDPVYRVGRYQGELEA